jgi:phosphoribosylaminoimidazole-succinocarboxamide synthase
VKYSPIRETNLKGIGPRHQGKVRDIYDLGEYLLLVATDRISAFDVVMNEPVPAKGIILNQLSLHWLRLTSDIVPNHLLSPFVTDYPPQCHEYASLLLNRSMLVKKCKVLPVECIVRGYLSGSGWSEYQKTGEIKGIKLPEGLKESDRLPEPIFTPSTKADLGQHDENISFATMADIIGPDLAKHVKELSLQLYIRARDYANSRGIIIADTKFEFGIDDTENGEITLIDEVLTPDSSRFWPSADYKPGGPQKSYDKQYLRDYLESLGWNKKPPPPRLPSEVISNTQAKYLRALKVLTSQDIS